jgi:hypothetical protein
MSGGGLAAVKRRAARVVGVRAVFGVISLAACNDPADSRVVKQAEFGVFFGGQVQELRTIKKELDPGRQRHGFRLTFAGPLARELPVTWEISLPVPAQGGPRAASVGEVTAKAGLSVLDVPLSFRASDPQGTWHAKVVAGGKAVIDREFEVVDPTARPKPKSSAP